MASFNYGSGDDTITGTVFGDDIWPGGGDDVVYALDGDDTIWSDQGNDYYDGGLGFDRVFYRNDTAGVTVDLLSGEATDGWGNTDTLVSIERVTGSNYDDYLYGTDNRDSFSGEQGDDYIDGRGGNDFVWYGRATSAVFVDLAAETAIGGEGNDTLVSIEFIGGSNYSDFLYGSSADNWFSPDAEGDTFTPNFDVGGDDYVDGRGGQDGVSYSVAVSSVFVDLEAETATDGLGNTDKLVSIEAAIGSQFNDVLRGSSAANMLDGGSGDDSLVGFSEDDTLRGGDGNDTLVGGDGNDLLEGGDGIDIHRPGAGEDTIDGGGSEIDIVDYYYEAVSNGIIVTFTAEQSGEIDDGFGNIDIFSNAYHIRGTEFGDQFYGAEGTQVALASDGVDTIDGGAGSDDWIDYIFTVDMGGFQGAVINFATNSFADTFGNLDVVSNVENIWGSDFSDDITGIDGVSHYFAGNGGGDTLVGANGDDRLDGGTGADRITPGSGSDIIFMGASDGAQDTLVLLDGFGSDTVHQFEVPIPDGSGGFLVGDRLDTNGLTGLTGNPVRANEVVVTDVGGDALLQFPNGESLLMVGVDASALTPDVLIAMGLAASDGIVTGTFAADLIDVAYTGDPDGDRIDNQDAYFAGIPTDDDFVEAGDGNDTILAGFGSDQVYGQAGDDEIDGGDGNDTIYGGVGNDLITDGALGDSSRNDYIDGGGGDDTIVNNGGTDTFIGGAGSDWLVTDVSTLPASFTLLFDNVDGVHGRLEDSPFPNDTISSIENFSLIGSWNARVIGGDENNTFVLDAGHDTILSGGGHDFLNAGSGNNDIQAGSGDDVVFSGEGDDTIDGGDGRDIINAGLGENNVSGGAGNDNITALGGNDIVDGGAGDDYLSTKAGNDTIFASTGADSVSAGSGDDQIDLGSADGSRDVIFIEDGAGADVVSGFEAPVSDGAGGYSGLDQIDVTWLTDNFGNPVNIYDVTVADDGNGNALLMFPNGESVVLLGVSPTILEDPLALNAIGIPLPPSDGIINGTAASDLIDTTYVGDPDGDLVDNGDAQLPGALADDDVIFAADGDDTVLSLFGADLVYGEAGNDSIDGGDGNDTLDGGLDDDIIWGGAGSDSIIGGDGQDTIFASIGDDSVDGGIGDDSLIGDSGNDSILGGEGLDTIVSGAGDDFADGGAGNDDISGGDGNDTLQSGGGRDTIHGNAGADSITGGNGGFYYGDTGNDTITISAGGGTADGGGEADSIVGSSWNDTLYGGEGDDTLTSGGGRDFIYGGAGDDRIVGGTSSSWSGGYNYGGEGNDTIFVGGNGSAYGDEGDDQLYGSRRNDSLHGGDNDDLIRLGGGRDYVDGGSGFDIAYFDTESQRIAVDLNADYSYSITTYRYYSGGPFGSWRTGTRLRNDDRLIDIEGVYGSNNDDQLRAADEGSWLFGYGGNDLIVGRIGNDTLLGGNGSDRIFGGAGGDTINGGANNDTIYGDAGSDTINGDIGNDMIYGNTGDDTIYGGAGSDTIEAGSGRDYMYGGAQADVVSLWQNDVNAGSVYDYIWDFENGIDKIALNGMGFGNGTSILQKVAVSTGVWLYQDGQAFLYIHDVSFEDIEISDFDFFA